MEAASLASVDTVYSADAIEFCPGRPRLFACGTYQVEGTEAGTSSSPSFTRYGRCLLYQVGSDGQSLCWCVSRFSLCEAVLAAHLSSRSPRPWNGSTTLAIADAKGHVQLHKLDEESNRLSPLQTIDCTDESTLCLSLDWSTRRSATPDPASIVVSLSDGSVCTLGGESAFEVTSSWHAHDFEPWIAAFDCWESSTVWTGGDDLMLKGWDLRQGCDRPTFVNKRTFEGGVTSIQSHQHVENLFAVGSYDSRIRLFDRRKPLVPVTEFDAGGGIWRLKWHPTDPTRLLVAGMHGGFKVVDFDGLALNGGSKQHARFDKHESLAYGVDWSDGGKTEDGKDLIASCSFYDHALHLWAA
ncbi:WD40-repeat-containing domain protein [Rhodotorula toruloides]